jgi:methionine aminopeptidase
MIIVKSREEIELMRESALIVSKTLGMIASEIKEGVTTLHLDKLAEEFIRDHGVPSFLGLYGSNSYVWPKCTSTRNTKQHTSKVVMLYQ